MCILCVLWLFPVGLWLWLTRTSTRRAAPNWIESGSSRAWGRWYDLCFSARAAWVMDEKRKNWLINLAAVQPLIGVNSFEFMSQIQCPFLEWWFCPHLPYLEWRLYLIASRLLICEKIPKNCVGCCAMNNVCYKKDILFDLSVST